MDNNRQRMSPFTVEKITLENWTKFVQATCTPFLRSQSWNHILASRLGDKVSVFSQHFQDCIYWPLESTFVLNNDAILISYLFILDISGSEKCWPFQGGTSFVDLLCFCSVLCLLCFVRVCLYVLRGHLLGKGWPLGSRLWCLLWVCHFPIGILGQVWYLIVSIPDLCNLTYFNRAETTCYRTNFHTPVLELFRT